MKPNFQDIPQLIHYPSTPLTVGWLHMQSTWMGVYEEGGCFINKDPDFQRGHIWTLEQKIAYVEFCLRGGRSSRSILWNHPGFSLSSPKPKQGNLPKNEVLLVDGLQRLTAVEEFLANKVPVFGYFRAEYAGRLDLNAAYFHFHLNELQQRADVLEWYLQLNYGGTPHSRDELDRVKKLWENEKD